MEYTSAQLLTPPSVTQAARPKINQNLRTNPPDTPSQPKAQKISLHPSDPRRISGPCPPKTRPKVGRPRPRRGPDNSEFPRPQASGTHKTLMRPPQPQNAPANPRSGRTFHPVARGSAPATSVRGTYGASKGQNLTPPRHGRGSSIPFLLSEVAGIAEPEDPGRCPGLVNHVPMGQPQGAVGTQRCTRSRGNPTARAASAQAGACAPGWGTSTPMKARDPFRPLMVWSE